MTVLEPLSRKQAELAVRNLPSADLAPRHRETLELLISGCTERQIAQGLEISRHTVHVYVKALFAHFGVSSRGELSAGILARWIAIPPGMRSGPDRRI
jgi:DNA-binding CsgD family transcriptional regulator